MKDQTLTSLVAMGCVTAIAIIYDGETLLPVVASLSAVISAPVAYSLGKKKAAAATEAA